jgi:hypothetical protein
VEPEAWTERMLTALEQGVKGSKWFSLMDKVYALPNLRKAFIVAYRVHEVGLAQTYRAIDE